MIILDSLQCKLINKASLKHVKNDEDDEYIEVLFTGEANINDFYEKPD